MTHDTRKVLDKHAKFLAAWEAAGFPDKFENEGTWLNNVRSTAEWYREQKQKAAKDKAVLLAGRDCCRRVASVSPVPADHTFR
jgi:hypothetical protein